ncbi:Hha/YmoA family nucleoid-associated regulatory protein [Klebsiella pneumoniae]|uniref:Hha/YmoA family nucleoid-associated regulatory protein n=1 Tax=Klebsiella pneumoniae TaxID=573 RepID=UPI001E3340CA|nr:Hha/YmoA family nucleoid-associated regulatory protein [Klebsiella pneumoniae]MCC5002424.1 hypothetical protein [Klebsiella pneumoniae]
MILQLSKSSIYSTKPRILDKLNDEGGDINKITSLNGAYDHRRAEIYMKKNYDKIPASVWHLIPDEI